MKTKNNRLVVSMGGVKGVGKSSVLQQLAKLYPAVTIRFVSREIEEFSLATSGKQFHTLEKPEKDTIRNEFGVFIANELRAFSGTIVLDCHYSDINEDVAKTIQPSSLVEIIDVFLLADTNTDLILLRRQKDKSRQRILDRNNIEIARESELRVGQKLAESVGRSFHVVDFTGIPEDNIHLIATLLCL